MLFVFQVDTGRMMTFDMNLAMGSIQNLNREIEKACGIPVDKQVLLISGGEHIDPDARVCSYPAGTDTNPFYLFSKATIELNGPPMISAEAVGGDFEAKMKECAELPPTLNTIARRTSLAQQFYDSSLELLKSCEILVHEQHLQHQGWLTVLANLEDVSTALSRRWELYQIEFDHYLSNRNAHLAFIERFRNDIYTLAKIPVLPALIELQKLVPDQDDVFESESIKENMSLLEWISQKEDNFLENLYDHCKKTLQLLDDKIFKLLTTDVERAFQLMDDPKMTDVKALGIRLSGLEDMMREARMLVQDQRNVTETFLKNHNRASNANDPSVLPNLCDSHSKSLSMLSDSHTRLKSITHRCINSKNELCSNLYERLKWVVYVENKFAETDNKLVYSFENMLTLQRQLEILQQVQLAPETYFSAVIEVVRRRSFSQSFLLWASELACHLLTIYNEEYTKRVEFKAQLDGHFLSSLFPGMDDLPPSFATQAPSVFDSKLPKLTDEDIIKLRTELPQFADLLNIPDFSSLTSFFASKSMLRDDVKTDENKTVEEIEERVTAMEEEVDQMASKLVKDPATTTPHGLPYLKDLDRGCESETDTEEFEKVSQSPFDLNFDKAIPSPRPGTQDAATLTEVGEKVSVPPKKPPRTFQKPQIYAQDESVSIPTPPSNSFQRTLSISGSQSNTDSFTNLKNPSLESIDELSSLRNFGSNTDSCFNSHYQQMQGCTSTHFLRSKSISPNTPLSPKDMRADSPNSPVMGHQPNDFVTDEFYIDESLPSSLSIETGQSQGEYVRQLDTANNVVALLQDNLQISKSEYEKLQSCLITLLSFAKQGLSQLRQEVMDLRNHFAQEKSDINKSHEGAVKSLTQFFSQREREITQRLTVDHELEISDFRKISQGKNEEIKRLRSENQQMEIRLAEISSQNELLVDEAQAMATQRGIDNQRYEKHIEELSAEHERSTKELGDRLKLEYRGEIENIRARFKLMTVERSPSESSLEKIDKGEFSSINTNHEALLLQMTENFESEKEVAVSDAVTKESLKWQKLLDDAVKEVQAKANEEKEYLIGDVSKRISTEKDKQIDVLREQINNLALECLKHKTTLQQLTENTEDTLNIELSQRIENLEKERDELATELQKYKSEKSVEMTTSVSVYEGKTDAVTSPIKMKKRSELSSSRLGKVNVESCRPGDLVVVMWDAATKHFKILQESTYAFFLHSDSLEELGLEVVDDQPNKQHCFGEVVSKEFCHARKPVNRFRVPKGTKFFRIRVKLPSLVAKEQSEVPQTSDPSPQVQMSQSQTTTSTSTEIVTAEGPHSLPSTPTKGQSFSFEKSETPSHHSIIPEEMEEDSAPLPEHPPESIQNEDIEKGTELTENYAVYESIDR